MADLEIDKIESEIKAVEKGEKTYKKATQTIKDYIKTQKELTKTTEKNKDALEDAVPALKEFIKVLNKSGTSSLEINEQLSDLPKQIKNIFALKDSFKEAGESIEKVREITEALGIEQSYTAREILKDNSKITSSFNNVLKTATRLTEINSNMALLPEILKDIKNNSKDMIDETSAKKSLDTLSGKLVELKGKGQLGGLPKDYEEIMELIKRAPLNEWKNFPKIIDTLKQKLSDIGESDIAVSLGEIKNVATFKDNLKSLMSLGDLTLGEDLKKEIDTINILLNDPIKNIDALNKKIPDFSEKIKNITKNQGEQIDKDFSKIEENIVNLEKTMSNFGKQLKESYVLKVNIEKADNEVQDINRTWKSSLLDLKAKDIIPDDQLVGAEEMTDLIKKLTVQTKKLGSIDEKIFKIQKKGEKVDKNVLKERKKTLKETNNTFKRLQGIKKVSEDYSDAVRSVAHQGFGEEKAQNLSQGFYKASVTLGQMGKKIPVFGKALEGVGSIVGKLGKTMSTLALPLGLLGAAVALGKIILGLEKDVAQQFSDVANSGAMFNATAKDINKALDETYWSAQNVSGTFQAWKTGTELPLVREEILGVSKAFFDVGIPLEKIQKDMKNLKTTAIGDKNALVGIATVVDSLAFDLNLSREEMAKNLGQMSLDFGSSMKSATESFVTISNAAKDSGISTNRFLAIVQTATAGMALYEDQVKSAAKAVSKLSQDSRLTSKDVENIAKSIPEVFEDPDKVAAIWAMIGDERRKAFGVSLEKDVKARVIEIEKKGTKATPIEKQQLQRMKEMLDAVKSGDITQIRNLAGFLQPEQQMKLVKSLYDTAKEQASKTGKTSYEILRGLLLQAGFSKEFVKTAIKNDGTFSESLDLSKGTLKTQQAYADLQAKDLKAKQKTEAVRNKAISTAAEAAKALAFGSVEIFGVTLDMKDILDKIFLALAALSAFATVIKILEALKVIQIAQLATSGIAGAAALAGIAAFAGVTLYSPDVNQPEVDKFQKKEGETQEDFKKRRLENQISDTKKLIEQKKLKGMSYDKELGWLKELENESKDILPKKEDRGREKQEELKRIVENLKASSEAPPPNNAPIAPPKKPETKPTEGKPRAGVGTSQVVININGGDEDRVRRIVSEELYKSTGNSSMT